MDDRRAEARLLADRYRLGALLGRGGAGRVHEAVDIALGRRVAVKVFQDDGNAFSRYRFAAEARLLASLRHPGLVTVHDVCLDGAEPFLVMELVDGPTLRDLLDRGPFEPAAVARIGARLAEVLAHVHAHDVVHRDIKPANVLVDQHGDCRLTDFGVARALGAAHLTATGEFVGTAAYLAPEQVTDAEVGPAADVYALGLLLLECLTGRIEYAGGTVESALARLNRPPHVPAGLSDSWRTLLTAMTARDPARRPDAAGCAAHLAAIAAGRTAALPTPPAPRSHTGALSRPRSVHAGLTALALVVACAVAATTTGATISGRPVSDPGYRSPAGQATEVVEPPPPPAGIPAATPRPAPVDETAGVAEHRHKGKDNRGPGKSNGKKKGKR
ncbi:serine/threonine-protein kinase [Actinophytocola sp. NPDC049390]|uniref:serine/threonine-protein kinase n=1 Tax=Actinophytocola sp. NPDC049390 TaxID=3363894 RepID=UPI0037A0AD9B